MPIRGVTPEAVKEAVSKGKKGAGSRGHTTIMMHELQVAYELLLDAKRHKLRIDDMVLALQDVSRTPPSSGEIIVKMRTVIMVMYDSRVSWWVVYFFRHELAVS